MTQQYHGSCHCGAIRFSFECEPITKGVRCNCSICARKGALMSPERVPAEKLKIETGDDALALYQFGTKTAKHYFCRHCGIYPFHEAALKPGHYRINLGCVDEIDSLALAFDVLDGKHLL
jgi:hypothetical protein